MIISEKSSINSLMVNGDDDKKVTPVTEKDVTMSLTSEFGNTFKSSCSKFNRT